MRPLVSFHAAASEELKEAARYYEAENPGLGEEFIGEIERSIESIVRNPEAAPIVAGSVRRRLTQRFPYAVLYSLRPRAIRVLAIAHTKRRPMYWARRV